MTEPSRLNWEACDRAVKLFSERETDILRQYYLTDYGRFDDMRVIEQYAIRYGMTRSELWDLVKKANYNVIVERGLMDRRELKGGETE